MSDDSTTSGSASTSPTDNQNEKHQELQRIRSMVRVNVTKFAALFLFVGGAILITAFMIIKDYVMAKDLFLAIMPVSASIIAFWFGGRGTGK